MSNKCKKIDQTNCIIGGNRPGDSAANYCWRPASLTIQNWNPLAIKPHGDGTAVVIPQHYLSRKLTSRNLMRLWFVLATKPIIIWMGSSVIKISAFKGLRIHISRSKSLSTFKRRHCCVKFPAKQYYNRKLFDNQFDNWWHLNDKWRF